jgi:phage baseplate assembly protein W|tara:strand:- start:138 stop:617 length:480 start_codon:yes stop_codon:yes gene_type:complete
MAINKTYGVKFPFTESVNGNYLTLTKSAEQEIRTDLLHLILTRKGSRYYLPDFGTRIYEFIFEPMDGPTFDAIKADIQTSVDKYIPNLQINNVSITPYTDEDKISVEELNTEDQSSEYEMFDIFRTAGEGVNEYTAKVKIDYSIKDTTFESRDFIIINI